jgi:hypothetical protein
MGLGRACDCDMWLWGGGVVDITHCCTTSPVGQFCVMLMLHTVWLGCKQYVVVSTAASLGCKQ